MTSQTWNKDSNLLYDYESRDFTSMELLVSSDGMLSKQEKKLKFFKKGEKYEGDYVVNIKLKNDQYYVMIDEAQKMKEKTLDERVWVVIKSTYYKRYGYRIREGDLIKLGKVMFKVRELKTEKSDKNDTKLNNLQKSAIFKGDTLFNGNNFEMGKLDCKISKRRGANPLCRICLLDENETDNPLIDPCNCTGSVKFIHLMCIRQWLKSKILTKNFNFLSVHTFKTFECEICKTFFPEQVRYRDMLYSLFEISKPETNYIMLESLSREKRENKYLYIISMQEKPIIRLGRSNESDVRMTDISVSRNHATIRLIQGEVYLEDNYSKFGTLTQMQNDLQIIPSKQLSIQSGKLFINFFMSKSCCSIFNCFKKKYDDIDYNHFLENKQPSDYLQEMANVQVINTDYSVSLDGRSQYPQSLSGKTIKEVSRAVSDTIQQKYSKEVQELKQELKEELSEYIHDYNNDSERYHRTINNELSVKAVPTDSNFNEKKQDQCKSYTALPNTSESGIPISNQLGKESLYLFPLHLYQEGEDVELKHESEDLNDFNTSQGALLLLNKSKKTEKRRNSKSSLNAVRKIPKSTKNKSNESISNLFPLLKKNTSIIKKNDENMNINNFNSNEVKSKCLELDFLSVKSPKIANEQIKASLLSVTSKDSKNKIHDVKDLINDIFTTSINNYISLSKRNQNEDIFLNTSLEESNKLKLDICDEVSGRKEICLSQMKECILDENLIGSERILISRPDEFFESVGHINPSHSRNKNSEMNTIDVTKDFK